MALKAVAADSVDLCCNNAEMQSQLQDAERVNKDDARRERGANRALEADLRDLRAALHEAEAQVIPDRTIMFSCAWVVSVQGMMKVWLIPAAQLRCGAQRGQQNAA